MKLSSRVALVGAVVLAGLLSGCGPNWKVVRVSGPPSALAGATDVALSFDYSQMYVEGKTESAWVSAKSAEDAKYPDTWMDLKSKFEAAVLEGLRNEVPGAHMASTGAAPVQMVVMPRTFKLGKFIPFALPPTVMEGGIVFIVGGQPTDEISLTRSYPSSVTQPSVFNHIPHVGREFGAAGGRLLSNARK